MLTILFVTNANLGYITAGFSVCSMIMLMIYVNNKKIATSNKFALILGILPVFSVLMLVFKLDAITLLFYNFCIVIVSVVLDYTVDEFRSSIVKKYELHSMVVEHQAVCEVFLNIGRIISYICMIITALFVGITPIKIAMLIFIAVIPVMMYYVLKIRNIDKKLQEEKQNIEIKNV